VPVGREPEEMASGDHGAWLERAPVSILVAQPVSED